MKRKNILFFIILIALLVVSFSYFTDSRKGIFTEKVGDMTLSGYDSREEAAQQISIVKQAVMEI